MMRYFQDSLPFPFKIKDNCMQGNAPKELILLIQRGDSAGTLHLKETRVGSKYGDSRYQKNKKH